MSRRLITYLSYLVWPSAWFGSIEYMFVEFTCDTVPLTVLISDYFFLKLFFKVCINEYLRPISLRPHSRSITLIGVLL